MENGGISVIGHPVQAVGVTRVVVDAAAGSRILIPVIAQVMVDAAASGSRTAYNKQPEGQALTQRLAGFVVTPPALEGCRVLPDGADQIQFRIMDHLIGVTALICRRSQCLRFLTETIHLDPGLLAAVLIVGAGLDKLIPHSLQGSLLLR